MLTTLRIKNLALVADLTLEFKPGYNVITGETGAGKSILIGALNLVLGERADRGLIRSGSDSCTVEAAFDITQLKARIENYLAQNGLEPCEGNLLLVKRSLSAGGVNRQFVNGSPTTLSVLGTLGEWLVDIHGPHEHQSLLSANKQLSILDAFGRLEPFLADFRSCLARLGELEAEKRALVADDRTLAQRMDHLRHQIYEIREAGFQEGEEESLVAEHSRASNSAKLMELAQAIESGLGEEESGLSAKLPAIGKLLLELKRVDGETGALLEIHHQIGDLVSELHRQISNYRERLEIDPERLQILEDRIDLLHSLKRKYGKSISEINSFAQEGSAELSRLEGREALLCKIDAEMGAVWANARQVAAKLSRGREDAIPRIVKAVTKELKTLGFPQSHFEIGIESSIPTSGTHARSTGFDKIEFGFSPNKGETARPLREIASSGEMARVMLALKTVLAVEDEVPTLIFDEVDANVGGETAGTVGEKMRQIGSRRQVLCITHLAPVAARASHHLFVDKQTVANRTISVVTELTGEGRVGELARMLGGKGDAARRHAAELLKSGNG